MKILLPPQLFHSASQAPERRKLPSAEACLLGALGLLQASSDSLITSRGIAGVRSVRNSGGKYQYGKFGPSQAGRGLSFSCLALVLLHQNPHLIFSSSRRPFLLLSLIGASLLPHPPLSPFTPSLRLRGHLRPSRPPRSRFLSRLLALALRLASVKPPAT